MKNTMWLYIGIGLAGLIYLVGFIMINNDLWNPLYQTYNLLSSNTKTKLWGEFFFQSASLALTILVLKFLLGMEPFKDAIKDIFSEIFSEQKFLEGFDKESLRKIAKNVHLANKDIDFFDKKENSEFIEKTNEHLRFLNKNDLIKVADSIHSVNKDISFLDKTKDNESVVKLHKYFDENIDANKNKNYLVIESKYSTTLLANGIEIMHRKIKCKIIKEGKFAFEYLFTSPDNTSDIDYLTYLDTAKNDRFNEVSYNRTLKSSIHDDGFELKDELSNSNIGDEKAVRIDFSKLHTQIGEILDIELSISHPFKLTEKEDIENYYNSTYAYPHAIRHIVFQLEKYNDEKSKNIPDIAPVLYSENDNLIKGNYDESIYYKTYSWEIYSSQEECEKVSIKIE